MKLRKGLRVRKAIEWRPRWQDAPVPLEIEEVEIHKFPDAGIDHPWYRATRPHSGEKLLIDPLSRGYTCDGGKPVEYVLARDILLLYKEAIANGAVYNDREPWEMETLEKLSMMEAMGALK